MRLDYIIFNLYFAIIVAIYPQLCTAGQTVSYKKTVEIAGPSVVNVFTTAEVEYDEHPFLEDPYFNLFLLKISVKLPAMKSKAKVLG